MIKSYCFDTEKDWDEGFHLLLFAGRESVQESLGFSPFELVFGHSVRGPLKLLKEKFLSNNQTHLNLSLNIFILHRLRNKFLQLILISLDSASWELHQYSGLELGTS